MVVAPAVLLVKTPFDESEFVERTLGRTVDTADQFVLCRLVAHDIVEDIIQRASCRNEFNDCHIRATSSLVSRKSTS